MVINKRIIKWIIILLFLFIFIFFFTGFLEGYQVPNFNPLLKNNIEKGIYDINDKEVVSSLTILKKTRLDDRLIVYYSYDNETSTQYGIQVFRKGFNFCYSMEALYESFGVEVNNQFNQIYVFTEKADYIVLIGKNEKHYSNIKYEFNHEIYEKEILISDEYFITAHQLPKDFEINERIKNIELKK